MEKKNMKKKTMASVLIVVAVIVIALAYPYVTKPKLPELPVTPPPKFEELKLKIGDSAMVKGNLIKLISIEKAKGIVTIEVYNETMAKPMVVSLNPRGDERGFKLDEHTAIFPLFASIEDDRVTFLIMEDPHYSEEDMQNQ